MQLREVDYDKYDMFIGMDSANIRNMQRILGGDPEGKIRKLNSTDVSDPWYSRDFVTTYNDIQKGCKKVCI